MHIRAIFLSVLVLGLAVAGTWHASGAVSGRDALHVAGAAGAGVTTSPPAPVTARLLAVGTAGVRAIWAPTGLFRATHLAAGIWLALAAALTALVAARVAAGREGRVGAALAAGLFAGAAVLFGSETGRLGLTGSPVPVLLVLLAGSAAAFTCERPRALLGGLLLGLATAEHPIVLFLLPGFGAMALGGTLRIPAAEGRRMIAGAWLGFGVGCAAILLPLVDARETDLLLVGNPDTIGRALAAWFGGVDGAFWALSGPRRWIPGALDAVFAAWRAVGPLGFVLGLAGVVVFFTGRARLGRPYLIAFLAPASAIVLGEFRDPHVASALIGWAFVFWTVPMFVLAWERFAGATGETRLRADFRTPFTAVLAGGALVAAGWAGLDGSAERGIAWAASAVETLPPDSILLTGNPVHVVVAASGTREDVDVLYLPEPSSLRSRRTGREYLPPGVRAPADRVRFGEIQLLLEFSLPTRPVLFDATLYFDPVWREAILGETRRAAPHGLAFRVIEPRKQVAEAAVQASVAAWESIDPTPGTPANPLRGGLTGDEWFGRALLQSGALWFQLDRKREAEDSLLLAFSHPSVNRNVAGVALARIFFERRNWQAAAETLEGNIRDDLDGAWIAHRLRASSLLRIGRNADAREELQRALRVTPPGLSKERASMERLLESIN